MDSDSGRQGVTISIMPSTSNISSALSSKSTFTRSEDDKPMDVMAARKDTRPAGVGPQFSPDADMCPYHPHISKAKASDDLGIISHVYQNRMKEILSHELHLPHQVPLIVELMLPSLAHDINWASVPTTLMPAAPQPALHAPLSSGLARTGRKIGRPQCVPRDRYYEQPPLTLDEWDEREELRVREEWSMRVQEEKENKKI
ncbi:hypothetical protein F4604DRAFT_1978522 [Suillus subluteus]|nr:hypothetical protein F4604DRAFT_1978522 [Suillus subluteus]